MGMIRDKKMVEIGKLMSKIELEGCTKGDIRKLVKLMGEHMDEMKKKEEKKP